MTAPAITITSTLEAIWSDVGVPIVIAALAASGPVGAAIAVLLKTPVIGTILQSILSRAVDGLIKNGVIEIKIGVIAYMSEAAQKKWADQLVILKQVSDAGKTMTPEEQVAYEVALQNLVSQHPGIVGA